MFNTRLRACDIVLCTSIRDPEKILTKMKTVPQTVITPEPMTGIDMQLTRNLLGLSVGDFNWMFGTNATHWGRYKRNPDEVLRASEVPMALLARFLKANPEMSLVPHEIPFKRVFEFFRLGTDLTLEEFGTAFGRHVSAGHRWVSTGTDAPVTLQHIAMILVMKATDGVGRSVDDCIENGVNERERQVIEDVWRSWWVHVVREAQSRGLAPDFYKTAGGWSGRSRKPRDGDMPAERKPRRKRGETPPEQE